MTDYPINCSAPEVRALLEGRKTMARQPAWRGCPKSCQMPFSVENHDVHPSLWQRVRPGDRLWVRESIWSRHDTDGEMGTVIDCGPVLDLGPDWCEIDYVATPNCLDPPKGERTGKYAPFTGEPEPGRWWFAPPDDWNGEDDDHAARGFWEFAPWGSLYTKHPSIHMPRWASRLTLVVIAVKIERLQDISEADAIAEGIERLRSGRGFYDPTRPHGIVHLGEYFTSAVDAFSALWRSLHSEPSWDANPEIVALSFTVEQRNIDAKEAALKARGVA